MGVASPPGRVFRYILSMISRLGLRFSAFFRKAAPDPFVLAVLLTIVSAIAALIYSTTRPESDSPLSPGGLLDAWRADKGMWKFLGFSMQMCLILVTGHALAASRPVARAIVRLANLPRSGPQAAAMVGLIAALTGLINWGLGLVVGALLAREVGRSLARRGVKAHYPLLVAAGYMGLLVWHGGLSGSAPLTSTTHKEAAKVLPEASLVHIGDGISLADTLFSPMNLMVSLGLLVLIPTVLWLLTPRDESQLVPFDTFDVAEPVCEQSEKPTTVPEWLERTPWLAWLLAMALALAFVRFGQKKGLQSLGLNEVNTAMLALGLVLHGSLASYGRAVEDAARGCAGIIIQFPLYAGIMAMLSASGLIQALSEALAKGGETGVPILTFLSAGIVNFFVPSGGGQWGIQGPIALEAGAAVGVSPGKMVMAVAYGDQLTNMLQPFWALPLLAITGVKARDIVGFTAVVMLFAAAWIALALLVF